MVTENIKLIGDDHYPQGHGVRVPGGAQAPADREVNALPLRAVQERAVLRRDACAGTLRRGGNSLARFCHRDDGDVWELTLRSGDPWCRDEATRAACDCPTGRLTARTKDGHLIEPEFTPTIEVLQDPERGVSGALFVKGGIDVESADGHVY